MIRTSQISQRKVPRQPLRQVVIAVLLVALAVTGLSACGSSHSSTSPSTAARAETPKSTTETPKSTPSTTPAASAPPPTTSTATTATPAEIAERERKHASLVAFVDCLRRQGYNVPEPDANNRINTHGLPLKNSKFTAAGTACFENPSKKGPGAQGPTKAP